jgi:hypothetical protein
MEKQGYTVLLQEDNTFVAWITEDIDIMLVSADKTNSLNFYTYVKNSPITLSQVNEWNRREKYSKLYLDGDGDVSLELDLDMTDGVTEERIISFLETCAETYPRFFKLAK